MEALIVTILLVVGILYLTAVLWVMYLAVMNLKRNQDSLTLPAKLFGYPVYWTGLFIDILYNLVIGTILFIQLPHELLFTTRLERNINDDSWRGKFARYFCDNLLDPFDPAGFHCRRKTEN